jgi:hypothetical protein
MEVLRSNAPHPVRFFWFSGLGNRICDEAVIWDYDYTEMPGHVVVTKHDSEGNLKYRMAIARPASDAMIRPPSFHAEEGTLDFEWWSGSHSGSSYNVTSVTRVKVREPA